MASVATCLHSSFFMNIKGLFSRKKSIQMRQAANRVERDEAGNLWYLSGAFRFGGLRRWKTFYDMSTLSDRSEALSVFTPLFTVVDKLGSMMSRGIPYVTDKDGNEKRAYTPVRALIERPNPLQHFPDFLKQIEVSLKVYGYCPLSLVRGHEGAVPSSMWIVPPELFHLQGSGKVFRQSDLKEIVNRAYIDWGGRRIELEPYEYVVICNSLIEMSSLENGDIRFPSPADSLSQAVSSWVASMSAGYTLMVNGGPKGILCSNYTDPMGNVEITPDEEKEIKDKFRDRYGLVGKEYPILVTRKRLSWIPLDFNSGALKLHEEDARCTEKIANAFGVNPNLFSDAKYDNQESAKKAAYQDVVIPDSMKIADALTRSICPEGARIRIDYSGVECLQPDKAREAATLESISSALGTLISMSLITEEEARAEVAKYMDIDPDNPKGEFRTEKEEKNDEQVQGQDGSQA